MKRIGMGLLVLLLVCGVTFSVAFGADEKAKESAKGGKTSWAEISAQSPENSPFQKRQHGHIADGVPDMVPQAYANYPRLVIDPELARKNGLQILDGERAVLVTDLEVTEEIRNLLPAIADAYPQVCKYMGIKPDPNWKLSVYLMKDDFKFIDSNLLPEILPPFQNGFSFNYDCWAREQPSAYYRQHLVIHEMIHSIATTMLGYAGPPWYAEGLAEMLATHTFGSKPLEIRVMPPNREAVPHYARVKELRDAVKRGEARPLLDVFNVTQQDYTTNAIYYWCWAMAWFLDNNPDSQEVFRALPQLLTKCRDHREFTRTFIKQLGDKLPSLEKQWQMFVATFDYGYELGPALFDTSEGEPLDYSKTTKLEISAQKGWQNTGIRLRKGESLRITASGRFEIYRSKKRSYPCEPGGVTIEYVYGAPMGVLQAVILPAEPVTKEEMNAFAEGSFFNPLNIGLDRKFQAPQSGTLLLRLNLPCKDFLKNKGAVQVEIAAER